MYQSNSKVTGTVISTRELTPELRSQMYELMDRYFSNVSHSQFEADLNEKEKVIMLTEHNTGLVCGFSTQTSFTLSELLRPVRILFSGDTIIDRKHWHSNSLASLWGKMVLDLLEEAPNCELYWLLLSKGFRTYRYLPVFFKTFYPCHNQSTPESIRELIAAAVRYKYPTRFDQETGVLYAKQYFLRPSYANVECERLNDPHIRFFMERNPGHVRGDELCCIAQITKDNFRRSAYRIMGM